MRKDLLIRFHAFFVEAVLRDSWCYSMPQMLLIEELVTILNRKCVANLPFIREAFAAWEGKECVTNMEPSEIANCDISVTCTNPDRVKVMVLLTRPENLTGVTEAKLCYDIAVKSNHTGTGTAISYQNIHMTIIFRGSDAELSAQKLREYHRNPHGSHLLSGNPPSIFPEKEGLILTTTPKGFSIPVSSMLLTNPVFIPFPDATT